LWPFIQAVFQLQEAIFGVAYPVLNAERRALKKTERDQIDLKEIKGDKFLNPRVFKKASWCKRFEPAERKKLAEFTLRNGSMGTRESISALAQAKLAYVDAVLDLASSFKGQFLGILVPVDAPGDRKITVLRKDYAYLFERFFYFVDSKPREHMGIIVFYELDKSASHILLGQMQSYYQDFKTGRDRSERLVPEPLFVHSDLTVGIQVADLAAYILSWGHEFDRKPLVPRARKELAPYVEKLQSLRIDSRIGEAKSEGIYVVYDLRSKREKQKGNAA